MTLRQLRYFVTLAETLHFGQAAERLHVTQPPLSRQIAALEQEIGARLLDRHSRSVTLTAAGVELQRRAIRLLSEVDHMAHSVRATAGGLQGELRLGFTMYAAWKILPSLVRRVEQAFPDIALKLEEIRAEELGDALREARIDAGIGLPLQKPRELGYASLLREPLCAVLPTDHRLAHAAEVVVSDLAMDDFITLPRRTAPALHDAVLSCCQQHGFSPRIRFETHLQQTIVALVGEGFGVSLVPATMAKMQSDHVVFRAITASPEIEQRLYWRKDNHNPCLPALRRCASELAGDDSERAAC